MMGVLIIALEYLILCFLHFVIVCLGLSVYLYGLYLHVNLLVVYIVLYALLWFYVVLARAFSASGGGAVLPIGSRWGQILGVCGCRALGLLGGLDSAGLPVVVLVGGTDRGVMRLFVS